MVDGGDGAEGLAAEEDEGAAERLPGVADDGVWLEGVERGGGRRADERAQAPPVPTASSMARALADLPVPLPFLLRASPRSGRPPPPRSAQI